MWYYLANQIKKRCKYGRYEPGCTSGSKPGFARRSNTGTDGNGRRSAGNRGLVTEFEQGFEFPWGYQITLSSIPKVPPIKLKARAPKNEQLSGTLSGYLAAHAAEGLPQRPIAKRTIYRYMGALLAYEKALQGVSPSP